MPAEKVEKFDAELPILGRRANRAASELRRISRDLYRGVARMKERARECSRLAELLEVSRQTLLQTREQGRAIREVFSPRKPK